MATKIWQNLNSLRSPASLSPGVVLGLTIHDPRLTFPKRMEARKDRGPLFFDTSAPWPKSAAISDIWKMEQHAEWENKKITEKTILKRKSKNLLPGMPLQPDESDSRIPLLLVQRGNTSLGSSKSFESQELSSGWDIILPKAWSRELWRALVFAGARVTGLRERRSSSYESGLPAFPYDYPETESYQNWDKEESQKRSKVYDRKPSQCKLNYKKIGIDSPFRSPFEELVASEPCVLRGHKILKILKESNPVQVAEYAMAHDIMDFPNLCSIDGAACRWC